MYKFNSTHMLKMATNTWELWQQTLYVSRVCNTGTARIWKITKPGILWSEPPSCLSHSFVPVKNTLSSQILRLGLSWIFHKALPCGWSPIKDRRDKLKPTRCLVSHRLLQNGPENVHKRQTPTAQQSISKHFYAERSLNLGRQKYKHDFLIPPSYL